MVRKRVTVHDELRLDEIAKHLGLTARYPDPSLQEEAAQACIGRIEPILKPLLPCTGERILNALASHFRVAFEEVRDQDDIASLEDKYLRRKREFGFARLRDELANPAVDALLFQCMHSRETDRDQWVAVLNLQNTSAKCYWNKGHELTHRIAEPPQQNLPFRRHRYEAGNPVESLIDAVTAEIAYYAPAFRPLVLREARSKHFLDFDGIERLRAAYAPTASLLATMKAAVKHWPRPVVALTAEYRGRVSDPTKDMALRITHESSSDSASDAELRFFRNMRVPRSSPIYSCYLTDIDACGNENLRSWTTREGDKLAGVAVCSMAKSFGSRGLYILIAAD
jgi:hypothetical protein